jgi:hypothetical protein
MEKGRKPDRNPYRNLKSENSQDDAQEKLNEIGRL